MSYRRVLLTRWSRRDWLAVGVVALITVFLVGTTLTLLTASDEIAGQARQFDADATATYYEDPAAAERAADGEDVLLPVSNATVGGERALVVGIPQSAPQRIESASLPWTEATLPRAPPPDRVLGPVDESARVPVRGPERTVEVTVTPETNRTMLSPDWYVANVGTVRDVGRTAAFVVETGDARPAADGDVPRDGTVILPVILYLIAGTNSLLQALALVTAGSGVLIAVAVYGITRLTVRDRLQAVFVVRATGSPPAQLVALFTLRAALVVTSGVVLGASLGVIVVNVAVNAAVSLGAITTLDPTITAEVLRVVGPELLALVVLGSVAGFLAVVSVMRRPPAALLSADERGPERGGVLGRLESVAALDVLDWRAAVPTTVSLTVFTVVVLLTASLGVTFAPLLAPQTGVITEPSAPHPLASRVDGDAATTLREQGYATSPEILLPQVVDGQPFLARGANYSAYAPLANATLVRGRPPDGPRQVVVGRDLARTIDVGVGDELTLGGGVSAGVTRVTVVGVYRAPGLEDDQLLVPLPTARYLGDMPDRTVNLIRTTSLDGRVVDDPDEDGSAAVDSPVVVTGVAVPETATAGRGVPVTVSIRNYGAARETRNVTVTVGNQSVEHTVEKRVRLEGGASKDTQVRVPVAEPGEYTVSVEGVTERVSVVAADALRLSQVPASAPPNATAFVRVANANGRPLGDAAVTVGDATVRTDADGVARLPLPDRPGRYEVTATKGDRRSPPRTVVVAPDAPRAPQVSLSVTPRTVTTGSTARADVTLVNPWARPIAPTVTLVDENRTVWTLEEELAPGSERTVGVRLPRAVEAGTHRVVVRVADQPVAGAGYRVVSEDGLVDALARSGQYTGGSALGLGVESILGNLVLLEWVMVVLATVMVVGSAVTGFAWAVSAGRRTAGIHRVTGATPAQLFRRLLGDAARIGAVSTALSLVLGLGLLVVLSRLGLLVVFGVRIDPTPPPVALALAAAGGVVLALGSVTIASVKLLRGPPGRLLGRTGGRALAGTRDGTEGRSEGRDE